MNLTRLSSTSSASSSLLARFIEVWRMALQNIWEPQVSNRLYYSPYSTKLRQQLMRVTRLFWLMTGLLAISMATSLAFI
jgi:hypothetical protein